MENVVYYTFSLISIINLIFIYANVTNQSHKKIVKFFPFIIVINLILAFTNSLGYLMLKTTSSLIVLIISNKIIYKNTNQKTIIYSLLVWFVGMVLDLIFMTLFSAACLKFSYLLNSKIEMILMYIATLILQILYNILSRFKFLAKSFDYCFKIYKKINNFIVIAFIMCFVYIGSRATLNLNEFNKEILLLILGFFSMVIIIQRMLSQYNKKVNEETIRLLSENNKYYSELNIDVRTFKHNLIYKLNGLKTCGNRKVCQLVDEIVDECKFLKKSSIEFDKLPLGLNGMVQQKVYDCDNKQIQIVVDNLITKDLFDLLKAKNYNKLCEVLGICLDNALESAKESEDNIIYMSFDEDENNVIITLQNTFGNRIDIDNIGNKNYSTKGFSRGIGLFSILFDKSIKTRTSIRNNLFEMRISVRKCIEE